MEFKTFGKVNVFLKILGKNKQNYHPLESRFCLARGHLYDEIAIKEADCFSLRGSFDCAVEKNLITKALNSLKKRLAPKDSKLLESISIDVEKRIPVGAGLGGGSSNAGNVLYHLNQSYFQLPDSVMFEICKEVGADVSFFYSQAVSANVSGIGEVVKEFAEEELEFEIFTPDVHCDTRLVYQAFDEACQEKRMEEQKEEWLGQTSLHLLETHHRSELNDLCNPAMRLYPKLQEINRELGDEWFFSGSGSSFFRLKKDLQ